MFEKRLAWYRVLSYHGNVSVRETEFFNDISEIKRFIKAQTETVRLLESRINSLEADKSSLQEEVKRLRSCLYGRKTEKTSALDINQHLLFCAAEDWLAKPPASEYEEDEVVVRKRKRRKRNFFHPDLPVRKKIIDIPEEEKMCACGCMKKNIGVEKSLRAGYTPASAWLLETNRLKYACPNCYGEDGEGPAVTIAPLPPRILGKSILSEELAAHLVVSKFADALPFYRQEAILRRIGLEISRATMAPNLIRVAEQLFPLQQLIEKRLLDSTCIGIDETPLQVMNEPGRSNTSLSYMWHFVAHTRDGPLPYFLYRETRSPKFLNTFLLEYQGPVVTDGYPAYNKFGETPGLIHAGCNAHARRKFVDAEKIAAGTPETAQIILLYRRIYAIEKDLKEARATAEVVLEQRQLRTKPLMAELREILDVLAAGITPESIRGKAVFYALEEWTKLIRFLDDPLIPIDNNEVERGIRPFTLGRKNWLFANTPRGAHATALFYTLMEWTKICGLNPYLYMLHLFENAGAAVTENDWEALLPCNIQPDSGTGAERQYAVS